MILRVILCNELNKNSNEKFLYMDTTLNVNLPHEVKRSKKK